MDGSSSKLGRMNIFLGVAVTLWIIFSAPFCEAVTITYSPPTECDIMNISWTGGQPPFVLNFITVYGAQSLQQLPSSAFTGSEGFYETRIPYPSGTLLLFILQDATGFPDGGTSDVISVGANVDGTTCYPTADTPNFDFKTDSYIQQCQPFNFFGYNDGTSQPITIIGMIPGAQAFTLTPPMGSTSFEWTASLPGSTTVLFTMVDAAGHRGAVTQLMTVEETSNTACLSGPSAVLSPTPTGKGISPPCPSPTSTRPSWTSSSPYTSTTPSASASATHRSLTAGEIAGISVASAFGTLLLLGCVVLPISRRLSRKRKAIDPPPPKPSKVMTVEKVDIGKTEIGNVEDNRAEPNPDPVNRKTDPPPQDPWPGRNVNMVYIQNAPPQANWENKNTLNNWNPPKSRKTSVRTPSVSSQSDKVDPQPSPLPPPKCPSVPSCKNEPVITCKPLRPVHPLSRTCPVHGHQVYKYINFTPRDAKGCVVHQKCTCVCPPRLLCKYPGICRCDPPPFPSTPRCETKQEVVGYRRYSPPCPVQPKPPTAVCDPCRPVWNRMQPCVSPKPPTCPPVCPRPWKPSGQGGAEYRKCTPSPVCIKSPSPAPSDCGWRTYTPSDHGSARYRTCPPPPKPCPRPPTPCPSKPVRYSPPPPARETSPIACGAKPESRQYAPIPPPNVNIRLNYNR